MGLDSEYTPPPSVRVEDVIFFLESLGFSVKNLDQEPIAYGLSYPKDRDYRLFEDIDSYVTVRDGRVKIFTHYSIWRSYWDDRLHNFMLINLKLRFGGKFITDFGKNTLIPEEKYPREKSEAACYYALFSINNKLSYLEEYIRILNNSSGEFSKIYSIIRPNPLSIGYTMSTSYIVGMIENYFKQCFVGLLKYSSRKIVIFKNYKILAEDMVDISEEKTTVEESIVKVMSFQNLSKLSSNFKEIDSRIDLFGILNNSKIGEERLFDILQTCLNQRHEYVHRFDIESHIDGEEVKKYMLAFELLAHTFYESLAKLYNWREYDLPKVGIKLTSTGEA